MSARSLPILGLADLQRPSAKIGAIQGLHRARCVEFGHCKVLTLEGPKWAGCPCGLDRGALRGGDIGYGGAWRALRTADVNKAKGHEPGFTVQQFERFCLTFCPSAAKAPFCREFPQGDLVVGAREIACAYPRVRGTPIVARIRNLEACGN